ncbi:MAG: ABC transporter permease [Planctomycetes bacterium]|nr:ABC transporter permease [Planctomycetota bacterium]
MLARLLHRLPSPLAALLRACLGAARSPWIHYVVRRLLVSLPTLLAVAALCFSLVHLMPGDPARAIAGEKAPEREVERVRKQYGLDRPLPEQFVRYLEQAVLRQDLGRSWLTKRPVAAELGRTLPATFELTLAAMLIASLVGVGAGSLAALRRGGLWDHLTMVGALAGVSVPVFFLGLLLLMAFGRWLPAGGRSDPTDLYELRTRLVLLDALLAGRLDRFLDGLRHLALPALALATIPMAVIARMTRSSLLEVLSRDYVRTARAKGLPERSVLVRHALRNALVPIVTTVGLQFGSLLAGAVLTETVFGWPGVGSYVVEAIARRDLVALQGGILLIATIFVAVNLAVDLLYALLDPRIQLR